MTLNEVITEILRRTGLTDVTNSRNLIKIAANRTILDMCKSLFECQIKEYRFVTTTPYSTGTVSGTAGTKTLTFAGATLTSGMAGRKIKISGQDVIYRLSTVNAGAGTATTDIDLIATVAASTAYEIYQDEYTMPYDYLAPFAVWRYGEPLEKDSRVWDIWYNQGEYESGEPLKFCEADWETAPYKNTGTITAAGTTITIAGGTFDSNDINRHIVVDSDSVEYRITAVAGDGLSCTVHKTGMVAVAAAFEIDPPPRRKIILFPAPDGVYPIDMKFYSHFLQVSNNNEQLPFPKVWHPVVLDGCYWKLSQHQKDVVLMNDAKADYYVGLNDSRIFNDKVKAKGRQRSSFHTYHEIEKRIETDTRRSADV